MALVTGIVRYPMRSYLPALALGCTAWSLETAGLRYLAGQLVDSLWASLGLGLALGALPSAAGLLVGRLLPQQSRPDGERAPLLHQLTRAESDS